MGKIQARHIKASLNHFFEDFLIIGSGPQRRNDLGSSFHIQIITQHCKKDMAAWYFFTGLRKNTVKIQRRRFLQSLAAIGAAPLLPLCARTSAAFSLEPDANALIDLPKGFHYRIVSTAFSMMDDGLNVPGKHDGMAVFPDNNGRVRIICNHEVKPQDQDLGPMREPASKLPDGLRYYDAGGGKTPGAGGTTTTIYDPAAGRTEAQFLSLAGTEINCAGGSTPWGSWLSCEETFKNPGISGDPFRPIIREQRHGYVFEVPAASDIAIDPVPLTALGRFEHEACAVHEASGVVYLTEDRLHSLFYRFLPKTPGRLADGGVLQALAIRGIGSVMTHNWSAERLLEVGDSLEVEWLTLEDTDPEENDLRLRGALQGAATFARGEGLCVSEDLIAFTCTNGGPDRLGQIFQYVPSPLEGTEGESATPGRLSLICEARPDSLLKNADNIAMAPWGDLVVCEDTSGECGLVGIRPDGSQYLLACSAYSSSELAGVCFSPDGETLFVNIQNPGTTLAIQGDWSKLG